MLAAVTQGKERVALVDVPEPPQPGPGEVLLRPEAVGICGSDLHLVAGELAVVGNATFPRVQGHELSATIEAVGVGCRPELEPGQRVALWPLRPCGECYPCRIGRPNVCANFSLYGVHVDGGLQERLVVPQRHVFPVDVDRPAVAALVEPTSIAMRAVNRARIESGEPVVVFGAGPIGQVCTLAALDRGARVLVVDLVTERLERSRAFGADVLTWTDRGSVVAAATEWAGGDVPVSLDCSGAADAVLAGIEMASRAGRVVLVGMSGAAVPSPVVTFVAKELDVLGVSVCQADEFAQAVSLVERYQDAMAALISHEFPFERTADALAFAMEHPTEVMKVVINL